jgi:hypothetical protein
MNITPEQVAEAIAEVIGAAENQGIVLTDRRLAQSNSELIRLLKSAADSGEWWGWLVSWSSITNQTNDDDCIVDVTYRFMALFQHFYTNDYQPGLTTDIAFQRIIFAANEALNASRDLGLGNLVRHQSLISEGEFETDDEGGGSANEKAHLALFSLDVVVTNQY